MLGRGFSVIVRPHPEYTKRYHARWESLQQRYASWSRDDIYFEQDFSTSDSVYDADVLVTDWSSIACEFSFTTMKPCVFVDTPMKVTNPDWEELGIEPADLAIRNQIGASLAMEELPRLGDVVEDMVARPEAWRNRIEEVRSRMIYHKGRGGEIAGAYLLDRMLAKQGDRAVEASGASRLDRAGVAAGSTRRCVMRDSSLPRFAARIGLVASDVAFPLVIALVLTLGFARRPTPTSTLRS